MAAPASTCFGNVSYTGHSTESAGEPLKRVNSIINRTVLREALDADPEADFEDVYLAAAGREAGAEIVVTRNEPDFTDGPLTPYDPERLFGNYRTRRTIMRIAAS